MSKVALDKLMAEIEESFAEDIRLKAIAREAYDKKKAANDKARKTTPSFKYDNTVKLSRRSSTNQQAHSLILERDDLADQMSQAVAGKYSLKPIQQQEVKDIFISSWPFIKGSLIGSLKGNKGIEVQSIGNTVTIIFYGERSNFDTLTETLFKARGTSARIFAVPMKRLTEYLTKPIKEYGAGRDIGDESLSIGDFLDAGHIRGSNTQYFLAGKLNSILDNFDPLERATVEKDLDFVFQQTNLKATVSNTRSIILELASLFGRGRPKDGDATKTFLIKMQYGKVNRSLGATEEAKIRTDFYDNLRKFADGKGALSWAARESTDSQMSRTAKVLMTQALMDGAVVKGLDKLNLKPNKVVRSYDKTTTIAIPVSKLKIRKPKKKKRKIKATTSYLSLITLINAKLPPQVRSNMGSPRLNNITGRLSESARVTNITPTAQGFPSIEYTYQRAPYDVFDKTLGAKPWNTTARDPSDLVSLSVRQIAQELGMKRFYTRRAG